MKRGAKKAARGGTGWRVSYTIGGRARTVRTFGTEDEARKFYSALLRRRSPPHEMAIEPEDPLTPTP
jgi:hypothetical protein